MRHHVALLRIALGLTAAFLLMCSCDETKRHEMLTFFFDGVPPLRAEQSGSELPGMNAGEPAGASQTNGWFVHKPINNCTECHGNSQRRTSSRQVQLVASVPQLCHKCHQEYAALKGWVHGPVAVGECLLCHEPHKAKNESLLVKPVPELCYGCHDSQAIRLIDGHAEESHVRCIRCHEGHAGVTKSLLKLAFLGTSAGQAVLSEVPGDAGASPAAPQGSVPVSLEARQNESARRDESAKPKLAPEDRYQSSVQAYHAAQFADARAGFLEVLADPSSSEPLKEMAKNYLEKIEWLQKEPSLSRLRPAR
jgi:predicted CXXCH cytochrome family protein